MLACVCLKSKMQRMLAQGKELCASNSVQFIPHMNTLTNASTKNLHNIYLHMMKDTNKTELYVLLCSVTDGVLYHSNMKRTAKPVLLTRHVTRK